MEHTSTSVLKICRSSCCRCLFVCDSCTRVRRGGAFNVAVRELLNYYVAMEEFVMEEDVHKAISIREHPAGNLTTSMVCPARTESPAPADGKDSAALGSGS